MQSTWKKILTSLILAFTIFFSFWFVQSTYSAPSNGKYLDKIKDKSDIKLSEAWWAKESIYKLSVDIAKTIKIIFYLIAVVYFMIIAIKLIVASNTEEEVSNFKKWFLWISIWIVLMNIAEFIVKSVYKKNLSLNNPYSSGINKLPDFANNLNENLINPLIKLLEFGTAFFFIIIMIFAFFRLVTSNWDEEKAKTGKMTILYAIIWFVVVKIASSLVFAVYGWCSKYNKLANIFWATCNNGSNLSGFAEIIFNVINWMNSFVAVVVIILVIFVWAQIIFSNWDEEKLTKAKKSILYIIIWIAILLFNYLILTFFFNV